MAQRRCAPCSLGNRLGSNYRTREDDCSSARHAAQMAGVHSNRRQRAAAWSHAGARRRPATTEPRRSRSRPGCSCRRIDWGGRIVGLVENAGRSSCGTRGRPRGEGPRARDLERFVSAIWTERLLRSRTRSTAADGRNRAAKSDFRYRSYRPTSSQSDADSAVAL